LRLRRHGSQRKSIAEGGVIVFRHLKFKLIIPLCYFVQPLSTAPLFAMQC
jgi:hypothetical protein